MLALLGIAVTASFFDSLNPSAIAQQMLLQAMVKNKRHIWFFILGIGLANFIMGVAVYCGVIIQLLRLWEQSILQYPLLIRGTEILAGIACVSIGLRMFMRTRNHSKSDTDPATKAPKRQLTPIGLFTIGAAFCMVELTSALPYFGFLAILAGYNLAMPYVLGFIFIYTTIYTAPLILLYFVYNRLLNTAFITRLESALSRISIYILPVAIIIVGGVMLIDGSYALIF